MKGQLSPVSREKVTGRAAAEVRSRSNAVTGDSPKSTDDSLTDFLRIPRARSKKGLAHAEVLFVVAEICSCADACRGGLPKPTDDSLTGFLQASPGRSKKSSVPAKQPDIGAAPQLQLKEALGLAPF